MSGIISSIYQRIFSVIQFIILMLSFRYDRFRPKEFDPLQDMSDLTGKVAIVTGGNAGIGFSTVKHLVRRGARVYMASRDELKATAAIFELEAGNTAPGAGRLEFLKLDLLDLRGVKKAAENILLRESRLDIIVNNASVLAALIQDPPEYHEGLLDYMLVNHISPFLFTRSLLPLLKTTSRKINSDVRIINVSSDAHFKAPLGTRFKTVEDFNVTYSEHKAPFYRRYCASKLANVLFTKELQRRLDADGVSIVAMALHPGNVNTFAKITPYPRVARCIMRLVFMDPDVGAYTTAFAAASPKVKTDARYKGGYLQPIARLGDASALANSVDLARELWDATEEILRDLGL